MKIVVLGSGTSHGIPVVGCSCPVCTSDDERDKRTRSSVYIEGSGGEGILIDAGPEFRLQALRAGIKALDGIFLTHSHADHIHGLDDVRPLSRDKPIPVYGNEQTISEMIERFSYVFDPGKSQQGGGKPKLNPRVVDSPVSPVHIGSLSVTAAPVKHGMLDILGWEVREKLPREKLPREKSPLEKSPLENANGSAAGPEKSFLYLTDTSAIPPATMAQFSGDSRQERIIIIGGLRVRPHETHFSFEQALNAVIGLEAKAIYLTHICHSHSHEEIEEFCLDFRKNHQASARKSETTEIHPARDGLELSL